jgi:hypothetical protein
MLSTLRKLISSVIAVIQVAVRVSDQLDLLRREPMIIFSRTKDHRRDPGRSLSPSKTEACCFLS